MSKGFDIESVEFEIPKQDMKNLVKKEILIEEILVYLTLIHFHFIGVIIFV